MKKIDLISSFFELIQYLLFFPDTRVHYGYEVKTNNYYASAGNYATVWKQNNTRARALKMTKSQ